MITHRTHVKFILILKDAFNFQLVTNPRHQIAHMNTNMYV